MRIENNCQKALATSALLLLYSFGIVSKIPKVSSGDTALPKLTTTMPAPYNTFGTPTSGGACGFESTQLEGHSGAGIAGWAILDAISRVLTEQVILAIGWQDNTSTSSTQTAEQADAANHFNNANLSRSSFKQSLSIKRATKPAIISVLLAFNQKLCQCDTGLKFIDMSWIIPWFQILILRLMVPTR